MKTLPFIVFCGLLCYNLQNSILMEDKMNVYELLNGIKKPEPAVSGEEFCFAAVGLDHGHIGGMCSGLVQAGAKLLYVCDSDENKARELAAKYGAEVASSLDEICADKRVKMVASAAVPSDRGPLGCEVMRRGLDYFVDKAPFTTLGQLVAAEKTVKETGKRYFVYYSERLHSECSIFAGYLLENDFIGDVVNIIGTGPHTINAPTRPEWFFDRKRYGGILCDIGSHQAEQFLYYSGSDRARVDDSSIGNFRYNEYPELDDFGDMHLTAANGVTGYHRVDWLSPHGLKSWGDGRCVIEGTKGYIEMRKNIDLTVGGGNILYLVNDDGEFRIDAGGKVGAPFFRDMILDCLDGTENAMTQSHIFAAARVSLIAQENARDLTPDVPNRR